MMQRQLKVQQLKLRVSHQSEVLRLQKQLVELEARLNALQKSQTDNMNMQANPISSAKSARICLPVDGGHKFVNTADIIYCEANGNYSRIYLSENSDNGKITSSILLSKTLKATEQLVMNTDCFIRCHQSYLINKNSIKGFLQKDGLFVQLSSDQLIAVSRRNKKKVMEACI